MENTIVGMTHGRQDRKAAALAAPFVFGPALVVGAVTGVLAGPAVGAVAFVVVVAALAGWVYWGADRLVRASLVGSGVAFRDADPQVDARLYNMAEGLATTIGVRCPKLAVLESDGLNAMVSGARRGRELVVVTSGLLRDLNVVELEAVLAEVLYRLRRGEVAAETALVATFGLGRSYLLGAGRDTRLDSEAVRITRYPPALASALEKMEAKGSAVPGQGARSAHLWVADPLAGSDAGRWRMSLSARREALQEL
jgi:heat shock protein HtpX